MKRLVSEQMDSFVADLKANKEELPSLSRFMLALYEYSTMAAKASKANPKAVYKVVKLDKSAGSNSPKRYLLSSDYTVTDVCQEVVRRYTEQYTRRAYALDLLNDMIMGLAEVVDTAQFFVGKDITETEEMEIEEAFAYLGTKLQKYVAPEDKYFISGRAAVRDKLVMVGHDIFYNPNYFTYVKSFEGAYNRLEEAYR